MILQGNRYSFIELPADEKSEEDGRDQHIRLHVKKVDTKYTQTEPLITLVISTQITTVLLTVAAASAKRHCPHARATRCGSFSSGKKTERKNETMLTTIEPNRLGKNPST